MLDKVINFVAGFFSIMLIVIGVRWLVDPSGSAEALGLSLMEGVGRSSQIGDMSTFFIVGGSVALLGVIRGNASFLLISASLVGLTAIFRTFAWGVHDAAFATDLIIPEVVMCAAFLLARSRIGKAG